MQRRRCRASILNRAEDGLPGAVRAAGCAAAGTASRATCCSIAATRERGVIDPAGGRAAARDHAAGRADGGDRIWSLAEPRALVPHVHRRRGIQTLPAPTLSRAARTPADAQRRLVGRG